MGAYFIKNIKFVISNYGANARHLANIKIYTQEGCFYCDQMKELCKRAEVEYESEDIETIISKKLME